MKPKCLIATLIATLIFGVALGWFVTWKNQVKPLNLQYEAQRAQIEKLSEYLLRLEKVADKLRLAHYILSAENQNYVRWMDIQIAE